MTDHRDPAIRVVAVAADANACGDIFGGWLLNLMDNAAGLGARISAFSLCRSASRR